MKQRSLQVKFSALKVCPQNAIKDSYSAEFNSRLKQSTHKPSKQILKPQLTQK